MTAEMLPGLKQSDSASFRLHTTPEQAREIGICLNCGNTALCPACDTHCWRCGTRVGEQLQDDEYGRGAARRSNTGSYTMKRILIWGVAAALLTLLATRNHVPDWLASYNREAAHVDDDLEQLSQP